VKREITVKVLAEHNVGVNETTKKAATTAPILIAAAGCNG
jgi:hypothetical protein